MSDSESVPDVPQTGAQASQSSHAAQGSIVQHPSAGAMAGIMPPGRLDTTANIADNWKVWKQMWSNYMVIAKLDSQPPEYKVALFLHCIGVEALKIFNGFQFDSPEDRNDMAKIIEKFDQFTIGELNETFERYTFNSRNQQENESIDVYVTALRTRSPRHVISAIACTTRSSVTGSSWAFKTNKHENGFYKKENSL